MIFHSLVSRRFNGFFLSEDPLGFGVLGFGSDGIVDYSFGDQGLWGSGFRVREFGFGLGFGVLSGFLTPKYLRKPLLT